MEEQYWQQFMKSGDVADYLGYKMEMYGHRENDRHQNVTEEVNKNGAYADPVTVQPEG